MPLVQAKCENCDGILQVDSSKKAAICPYCGTPYVVQDAINNYTTHIEHLHADVVNVNSDTSAKARLDAAEAFMKLHKYREAWKAFEDVCSLTPQDYRGWWGKIRVYTEDFTLQIENKSTLDEVSKLYQAVLVFVPELKKGEIEQQFQNYYQPLEERYSQKSENLKKRIRLLQSEHTKLQAAINELEKLNYPQVGFMSNGVFAMCGVVFGFSLVLGSASEQAFFIISLTGILLAASLVWEIFIRPVRNIVSASKEKKTKKELDRIRGARLNTQEKLRQAETELDRISS